MTLNAPPIGTVLRPVVEFRLVSVSDDGQTVDVAYYPTGWPSAIGTYRLPSSTFFK